MNESTGTAPVVWTVFYVVDGPDGHVFHIEKSSDGCTRTVLR